MKHFREHVSRMFLLVLSFFSFSGRIKKNVLTLRLVHQTPSPANHATVDTPPSLVVSVAARPALTGQQCRSSSPPFLPIPRKKGVFKF